MSIEGINVPYMGMGVGVDSITPSGGFAIRGDIEIYPSGYDIKIYQSGNRLYIGEHLHDQGEMWVTGNANAYGGGVAGTVYPISGFAQTGAIMQSFVPSGSGFLVYQSSDLFMGYAICNGTVNKPGGGDKNIAIYLTKNGSFVPTTRRLTLPGNGKPQVFAIQTSITLVSGEYVGFSASNLDNAETFLFSDYNLIVRE